MKKTFLFAAIAAFAFIRPALAQVVPNPASSGSTPDAAPAAVQPAAPTTPPPPPPPAPAPQSAVRATPPPPATPTYDPQPKHPINVNKLRFGAYLAPDISWMKPTTSSDDDKVYDVKSNGSKVGFIYGLMADYFFAPNYGFVTGIQVNSTGGKIVATVKDPSKAANKVLNADFNYQLQYLEIPIALKLRTDEIKGFRFFGQLGLTTGFNISKKADYTVNFFGADSMQASKSDTKAKISGSVGCIAPIMLQMNIGAGAEYPINNKLSAYVGLFFNNGFTPDATKPDLFDNAKLGYNGSFKDANTRLNNFALRLGLFF